MQAGVGIFEFVLLFVFTAALLRYYAHRNIHFSYLAAVFVSWYVRAEPQADMCSALSCSLDWRLACPRHWLCAMFRIRRYLGFFGTLLLPVDVEETIEQDAHDLFEDLWMFVYWSTFILSWIVLPVLMVSRRLRPTCAPPP